MEIRKDISTTFEQEIEIPREDRIRNPVRAYSPTELPKHEKYVPTVIKYYEEFIKNILPQFVLNPPTKETSIIYDFIKERLDDEEFPALYCELIVHSYLLRCSERQTALITSPSLTRLSILHNELHLMSELIRNNRKIPFQIVEHCDMMIAETEDLYYTNFSDIIEHKFWGKTKTVKDLIVGLLTKEFEKLRTLSKFTYEHLTSLAMRKAIDSAPATTVHELIRWGHENMIKME